MSESIFESVEGFEWDEHNLYKNERKHNVHYTEVEELFFNRPLVVGDDHKHSQSEKRYYVLGRTDAGRKLFVVFTIRNNKIRVISARDMSRKERRIYEQKLKSLD